MHDLTQTPIDADAPAMQPPPLRAERGIAATMPNWVDGAGLPKFAIDERTVLSQHKYRGYIVTIGYALDPDNGRADAAITIFPERVFDDAGAWVITRRGVMKFSDEHNHPTPHAFEQAMEALPILGYDQTKAELIRLVDTVMTFVDDLVQAPVPRLATQLILQGDPMWDVTIHAKGAPNKVLREASI